MIGKAKQFIRFFRWFTSSYDLDFLSQRLAVGRVLANQQRDLEGGALQDYGFQVFSQFDDDGIIEYLIKQLKPEDQTFIEFGVGNYTESNTRFLLMNRNWRGFVMDGSAKNIQYLQNERWYWKFDLQSKAAFITAENINRLLDESGFEKISLLHIDIDGNDYHVLKALDPKWHPEILILEYNHLFGAERALTLPYDPAFIRSKHHYSRLLYGASLAALTDLANSLGYVLIACNKGGNNAYYIRRSLLTDALPEKSVAEAFVQGRFRDGIDKNNKLLLTTFEEAQEMLTGCEVLNTRTGELEAF